MKHLSFFIMILLVTMVGCKTMQPTVGTTIRNDSISVRTEYVHDTTFIEKLREVIKTPDTIYIHDSIVIYKFRDRVKTDTLVRYHSDTIQIVSTEYVEKPIAPFVRNSCIALWCIIAAVVLLLIIRLVWGIAKGNISWLGIVTKVLKIFGK